MKRLPVLILLLLLVGFAAKAQQRVTGARFKAIVLYENKGHHVEYSSAAKLWLNQLAADSGFNVVYIQNTDNIDSAFLTNYKLFIQLDYPPYGWNATAAAAFKDYIENGRGGWIGFHHATLLGEFDGFPKWQWFSDLMGGIEFKNYIATFAAANVKVEDTQHPVMKGIPATFKIAKEEWYTYNKSPRPNVKVLASVDEASYSPNSNIKMGDHPVIWTNTKVKARNVYIFMGHSPGLFQNAVYKAMLTNAIFWAAGVNH